MEGEPKNLAILFSSILLSLSYSYFFCTKIPRGKYRFISLLPIFSLFTILPLSLSYAFTTAVSTFFITWLSNFKLLLFAFDHGPLYPPKSFLVFITTASLPFKIKQPIDKSSQSTKKLPLNLATEIIGFAILIPLVYDYKQKLNPMILLVVYCCLIFLLIDILVALSNAVVYAVVGFELESPSDEPYLAGSLQEFWGRRWNLMVTNILRHTVYIPVRSTCESLVDRNWAPVPAILATFLVSGLMHELLFYYVTRVDPTWEMTSFFVLHGFCVVAELVVKRAFAGKWRLPWFVARPLTVGFMVATSFWLFFPPLINSGADVKVLEEFMLVLDFIKNKLKLKLHFG